MSEVDEIINGTHIDIGPLSLKEIEGVIKKREEITITELSKGYELIKKYPRTVSILGSARFKEGSPYYEQARSLGNRIVKDLLYGVVTGGGPGIMEAANRGAYEAGGVSLGFTIKLPAEQGTNKYVTDFVEFEYFFTRKTLLFFAAEAYIYFPGGFGTFDEFFEIVTLIQTKKISKAPVILVGKKFWEPLLKLVAEKLLEENHTIDEVDMSIYKLVDSEDEIIEIIKNAPYRQE
jgi:hypothetical protein